MRLHPVGVRAMVLGVEEVFQIPIGLIGPIASRCLCL